MYYILILLKFINNKIFRIYFSLSTCSLSRIDNIKIFQLRGMRKDSRDRLLEKNVCLFLKKIKNMRECSRTFFQVPPTGPGLQRQPSVGNVLARASSFSTTGGPLLPRQISAVTDHHHESLQLQRQTSAGSPISQKPNDGSTVQRQNSGGSSTSTTTGNGVLRQGSQGSLFEQIASQAKDLVRETTRQSSQDGLLAHMDKVFTRKACVDDEIFWRKLFIF